MRTRILLADDHKLIRAGLFSLFAGEDDMHVVAEAADGHTALALAKQTPVDIVLMDISMPGLNGIEATRAILEHNPKIKIIGLSMYHSSQFIARLFDAGAKGFLIKDSAFKEVVDAIRTVLNDQIYISPSVGNSIIAGFVRDTKATCQPIDAVLSGRERQILQMVAEGQTPKEIAHELDVSVKTVNSHRQNLMEKLNIRSVADLTKFAIRNGITSLEY